MAILEEETFKKFGYYASDLTQKSNKKIVVVCDNCDKVREIINYNYRDLCRSCSMKGKKGYMSGKHHSEEVKKKISKALKKRFKSEKNNFFGKHHTKEAKEKISKFNKGKFAGENSPHWKGGISFEPYCHKFNDEFKQYVRVKFGNVCFLCNKTEEENGQRLSVHHVNYDKTCGCAETEEAKKEDNKSCQFVPLCRSCNSKVNTNRDLWERRIKNEMKNKLNGWFI